MKICTNTPADDMAQEQDNSKGCEQNVVWNKQQVLNQQMIVIQALYN